MIPGRLSYRDFRETGPRAYIKAAVYNHPMQGNPSTSWILNLIIIIIIIITIIIIIIIITIFIQGAHFTMSDIQWDPVNFAQWIPHSRYWIQDFWQLNLDFGLKSPGFWILQEKIAGFWIPQAKISRILESGFPYMGWLICGITEFFWDSLEVSIWYFHFG